MLPAEGAGATINYELVIALGQYLDPRLLLSATPTATTFEGIGDGRDDDRIVIVHVRARRANHRWW
jgi:hypothetical protein